MLIAEVAKALGVDHSTVLKWCKAGRFKGAKLKNTLTGQVWIIPRRAVENLKRPARGRPKGKKR